MKLTVVHAPGVDIEIVKEQSIFAPRDYVYLVPDKANFGEWARTMFSIEKEKNEWIRKYENVLSGLNYWKNKYLECDDVSL